MRPYTELGGVEEIVLEESFVLGVTAEPGTLSLAVDFVLTRSHPAYTPPPANEVECFKRGSLHFTRLRRLVWDEQDSRPAVDASGERDWGHIAAFEWESGRYILAGELGRIDVNADAIEVVLSSGT